MSDKPKVASNFGYVEEKEFLLTISEDHYGRNIEKIQLYNLSLLSTKRYLAMKERSGLETYRLDAESLLDRLKDTVHGDEDDEQG